MHSLFSIQLRHSSFVMYSPLMDNSLP